MKMQRHYLYKFSGLNVMQSTSANKEKDYIEMVWTEKNGTKEYYEKKKCRDGNISTNIVIGLCRFGHLLRAQFIFKKRLVVK